MVVMVVVEVVVVIHWLIGIIRGNLPSSGLQAMLVALTKFKVIFFPLGNYPKF